MPASWPTREDKAEPELILDGTTRKPRPGGRASANPPALNRLPLFWSSAAVRQCPRRATRPKENGVEPTNLELLLEDARSISGGLWRMIWLAQEAAEALDSRIENEDLDGLVEAVEVRKALERM